MAYPFSFAGIVTNAEGCPSPIMTGNGLDVFDLTVDWEHACVNPGEAPVIRFNLLCGGGCHDPEPFCYYWTRFWTPVFVGPSDCPWPAQAPTPTPTPRR